MSNLQRNVKLAFENQPSGAFRYTNHANDKEDDGQTINHGQPIPVEITAQNKSEKDTNAAHELNKAAQDSSHVR